MLKQKFGKKGFTLAELLIVIAIIAILIAIMIPVFGAQLDKARAAAELANVRAKYSELIADQMLGGGSSNLSDPISSVSIKFSDLQAAEQYTTDTFITIGTAAATAKATADSTEMPTLAEGDKLYVTVTYKNYFGSFEIDKDVTFTDFPTSG